jgi:hypothetical protein
VFWTREWGARIADVASARATQWTDRATRPAASAAAKAKEPAMDVATAMRSGDVDDMRSSFLADLLGDD